MSAFNLKADCYSRKADSNFAAGAGIDYFNEDSRHKQTFDKKGDEQTLKTIISPSRLLRRL